MSQVYTFKHNIDTARKYAYPPFAFRLYCIFERFTDLHFLNEYIRTCVIAYALIRANLGCFWLFRLASPP